MNLDRQLPAIFGGHHALEVLHNARKHAAVIVELLTAVFDFHPGLPAYQLVMRALVGILEAAPTPHIIDEEIAIVRFGSGDDADKTSQPGSVLDPKPAFAFVSVGSNDLQVASVSIGRDDGGLILDRVSLPLGRHANVLRRSLRLF